MAIGQIYESDPVSVIVHDPDRLIKRNLGALSQPQVPLMLLIGNGGDGIICIHTDVLLDSMRGFVRHQAIAHCRIDFRMGVTLWSENK